MSETLPLNFSSFVLRYSFPTPMHLFLWQILQLQQVSLEPLIYIGLQFVLDPLSNLVYLPTTKGGDATPGEGAGKAWGSSKSVELQR